MCDAEKEKKAKVDKEAGRSDTCSLQLLQSIVAVQDELNQINAQSDKEALKFEREFDVWRKPFYARRDKIIRSIRDFWLVTFCNHPILGDLLTEEDKKILKNLVCLEVEEAHDVKHGFSISFSFSPNPYFEDEKLTKRYMFDHGGYLVVACDPINWKERKGTFDGGHFNKQGKRPHTSPSFFCWFSDVVRFDGEIDEIANIIRGDIWPNPLWYFQKADTVGVHNIEDSQVDTQDSEVTEGGNEADDEREEEDNGDLCVEDVGSCNAEDNKDGEWNKDYYVKDFGSCDAEDNEDGERNKDYWEEVDEYDEGYHADVDEDDSGIKDEYDEDYAIFPHSMQIKLRKL